MSHCWFASIEVAVSGMQSVLSGGVFISRWNSSWCGLLQYFTSHFRGRAVSCPFSPSSSNHWETSFPILCLLSHQDGSFLREGIQNLSVLLLSLKVTFTRDQHNSCSCPMLCSAELLESVIWDTQMYYSALIHSMGETCRSGEVYLAKDLKLKNRVICLLLLPMEE